MFGIRSRRDRFRRQLAEYLSSAPAVDVGTHALYVRLDSVRIAAGPLGDSYQVGYFLTPVRLPQDFETIAQKKPTLRRSTDDVPGTLHVGGFQSGDGFELACRKFETLAAQRHQAMAADDRPAQIVHGGPARAGVVLGSAQVRPVPPTNPTVGR